MTYQPAARKHYDVLARRLDRAGEALRDRRLSSPRSIAPSRRLNF